MLTAIEFNDKPARKTYKIDKIPPQRLLAAKLEPSKTFCAQCLPHRLFVRGFVVTKGASA
jgi:hypothetical protein